MLLDFEGLTLELLMIAILFLSLHRNLLCGVLCSIKGVSDSKGPEMRLLIHLFNNKCLALI
jgi:hypothetical protein